MEFIKGIGLVGNIEGQKDCPRCHNTGWQAVSDSTGEVDYEPCGH